MDKWILGTLLFQYSALAVYYGFLCDFRRCVYWAGACLIQYAVMKGLS